MGNCGSAGRARGDDWRLREAGSVGPSGRPVGRQAVVGSDAGHDFRPDTWVGPGMGQEKTLDCLGPI